MVEVVNMVGGGQVGRELDLSELTNEIEGSRVEYNPASFAGLIIEFEEAQPTVILFTSGKFSIAGAKSRPQFDDTYNQLIDELNKLGISGLNPSFEVRYMVVSADLHQEIDLERLSIQLGMENIEYEPEQFPGLFYRRDDLEVLYLIFSSGKVNISGPPDQSLIEDALTDLHQKIRQG
jgi:transcription initiation factor TFIID TATA-box-binding protein